PAKIRKFAAGMAALVKWRILNVWAWGVVRGVFGFADFDGEPGTGVGPPFFGGGEGDAEDECGFLRMGDLSWREGLAPRC
ncbi:MAG: hypothetical protein ACXW32_01080, partial [Limisphaerales bacterium]